MLARWTDPNGWPQAETAPRRWPQGERSDEADALRTACAFDQAHFAHEFFPDFCTAPFNTMHEDFFALARTRLQTQARGWRDVTAAPRGSAKTTVKGKIQLLHDAIYGTEQYIIIGSANAELARDKVKELREIFEDNAKLRRIYGPQETKEWRMGDFITAGGCHFRAFTPRSNVRGVLRRGQRPTKIMLDDGESRDDVLTQLRRDRIWQWYTQDVARLGVDGYTNFDIIGTVLHPESLLARLLKQPGYTAHFYKAVMQFAGDGAACSVEAQQTCLELWRQWRTIMLQAGPAHMDAARAFYEAHEAAMTVGAEVLWPQRQSYYSLMVSRIVDGETSFFSELQNNPLADQRYLFNMEDAAYCTVQPGGLVRADGTFIPWLDIPDLAAAWDPTPDKRDATGSDFASCAVVCRDIYGFLYAIDAYLKQETSTEAQIDAVVDLLWHWQIPVLGIEANNFASLLVGNIRQAIAQRAQAEGVQWDVTLVPISNMRNKILRIRTLEPIVNNGWLQFARTLPPEALRQMREFLPVENASHDDYPDSVEMACRVVQGLYDKQAFG